MPRHDPVPTAPNLLSLAANPKLPALVKKLPHPVLAKLIDAVGVEDAGPLVAMTTPQQMRVLFDDVLWENPSPDLPARFSVGEFLRWLEVLNEESVAFTAERLQTLGEQFLSASLGRILDRTRQGCAIRRPSRVGRPRGLRRLPGSDTPGIRRSLGYGSHDPRRAA